MQRVPRRGGRNALLLDCGRACSRKLRAVLDYVDVDAVVISHLHADHFLDLVPYASALKYAPRQQPVPVDGWPGTDDPARPLLVAPPGAADAFRARVRGAGMSGDHVEGGFRLRSSTGRAAPSSARCALRFQAVPHFIPTWAIEVAARRRPAHLRRGLRAQRRAVRVRRDTDLLLMEATLPRPER